MRSGKKVNRILNWGEYVKAKTNGFAYGAAGFSLILLAVLGMLLCVVLLIFSVSLLIDGGFAAVVVGLVICAVVAAFSVLVGKCGIHVMEVAHEANNVDPITDGNVHLLPETDTLVRGAAAPELIAQKELLRSVEEIATPDREMLRAVDDVGDR